MPLKQEPASVKIRLEQQDKEHLDAECARRQTTQQELVLAILRRYHSLPNLCRLWFVGQLDKGEESTAADAFGDFMRGKRRK